MPACRVEFEGVVRAIGCILVLFASHVYVAHAQSTCTDGLPNVQKEFVSGGSTFPFYFSLCEPLTTMVPAGCPSGCYGLQKTSGACFCLGRNSPIVWRTGNTIMFSSNGGDPYSDGTPRRMTVEVTCSLDELAPTVVEMKPTYEFSWTTSLCGPNSTNSSCPPTVPNFDIQRFMGTWFTIASSPRQNQNGEVCMTSTFSYDSYTKRISVENSAYLFTLEGPRSVVVGEGIPDATNPSSISMYLNTSVGLTGPISYTICLIANDYSWAVTSSCTNTPVGELSYATIISRTPTLSYDEISSIVRDMVAYGFSVESKLNLNMVPSCE